MARPKQTPRKEDKKMNVGDFVKQPSKLGVAAKVPSHRPPRDASGLPSYKGMS